MADFGQIKRKLVGEHQIKLFEHERRHFVFVLGEQDIIATFAQDAVNCWGPVQRRESTRLRRGDRVSFLSHDGLTEYDSCPVLKAQGNSVWFGKPLRIITFEEDALYSDGHKQVVPQGTGYAIKDIASGTVSPNVYLTADAAKSALLREQPVRV